MKKVRSEATTGLKTDNFYSCFLGYHCLITDHRIEFRAALDEVNIRV